MTASAAGNSTYDIMSDAEAYWVLNTAPSGSQDAGTYSTSWVGINSGVLMQAGTESDGQSTPYLWYEVFDPQTNSDIANSLLLYANNGDTAFVHVTAAGSSVTFHVQDLTQLQDWHITVPGLGSRGTAGQAQWMVERPEIGANFTRLARVSATFTTAQAAGPYNGWTGVNSLGRYTYKMRNCSQVGGATLANAGSAVGSTQFTVSWVAYGTAYPWKTCT